MDKIFICKEESSNKFWGYTKDLNNYNVEVKWGRLGLDGQKQIKSFKGTYDRDEFIGDKTGEKLNGGYEEVTVEEYEVQASIAKTLGVGHKIDDIFFVEENGCYISELSTKDLHKPNVKPKVYAKVVGRRTPANAEPPVTLFLFDVNASYKIKLGGTHPQKARMQVTNRSLIMPGDENEKLAAAVGEVIGRVLL